MFFVFSLILSSAPSNTDWGKISFEEFNRLCIFGLFIIIIFLVFFCFYLLYRVNDIRIKMENEKRKQK